MKVKFENKLDDFEAAIRYQMNNTPEGRRRFNMGFLKLQFIPAILALIAYFIEGWMSFGITFVVLNILSYVFGRSIFIKAAIMQQQKGQLGDPHSPFFQEKTISPGYAGINCRFGKEQGMVSWQKVNKIGQTDEHIFLFAGEEIQFIIPANAFPKPENFGRFLDELKKFSGKKVTWLAA